MEIRWYGHTAFELKHKSLIALVDPYGTDVGLGTPHWKCDIATICNRDYTANVLPSLLGNPKVIDAPGEYEIKDLFVYGIVGSMKEGDKKEAKTNIIFKFEHENRHICALSHLGEKLTDQQQEQIGIVDILLLPLGSEKTMNIKESKELIEQLDPRVIIPVDTTQKKDNPMESEVIQEFIKLMGKTSSEPLPFLDLEKYPYNEEKTDIVLLMKTPLK
jgi:L-ascorbate metabolism protein UlaG (beta-lactamase superfamily)